MSLTVPRTRNRRETNNLQNYTSQRRIRNTIVQHSAPAPPKINFNDFEVISILGKGGFGVVYLVRKTDTKEILALKRCSKADISARNKSSEITNERNILAKSVQHKNLWLVNLMYSFQDENYFFMAMEFMPGGDLGTVLRNLGFMQLLSAQFYMAEMVMCVATLHKLGYIHRDLKPPNFLVDKEGHLKLGDFGLSKAGVNSRMGTIMGNMLPIPNQPKLEVKNNFSTRRNTFLKNIQLNNLMATTIAQEQASNLPEIVGSADYIPPEILRGGTYTFGADWWSLGVILYEMLAGVPPFYSENVQELFANILNYSKILQFPSVLDDDGTELIEMSDDAWALINRLLCEPDDRMGLERGSIPITDHPFFNGIVWNRNMNPPFVPELESETDTSYFDAVPSPDDKDEKGGSNVKIVGFSFRGVNEETLAKARAAQIPSLISSPDLLIEPSSPSSPRRKRGECVTGLGIKPENSINIKNFTPDNITPQTKANLITQLISSQESHLMFDVYYNIMKPDEILEELIARFNTSGNSGKTAINSSESTKWTLPIQLRVLHVLEQWITHYPSNFEDLFMRQRLESFISVQKTENHPVIAPEIERLHSIFLDKTRKKSIPKFVIT